MDKYKNKYRIESARAQWWDYGWNGAYFITICTQNREHFFGKIREAQFIASPSGQVAETIWHEIPKQFPYAALGEFVVMPNHIHGILILNKPTTLAIDPMAVVQARLIAPPQSQQQQQQQQQQPGGKTGNKNPMLNENIPRIIRWYKGRCTFEIRKIQADFAWQSRYHDHIIRNDGEYQRISNYIVNNPIQWPQDKFSKPE